MPPRIAVIGSGAAAAGALLGVRGRFPQAEICLFERREPPDPPPIPPPSANPPSEYWHRLSQQTRRRHGLSFPPPKTHWGAKCPTLQVPDWGKLWEARDRGGLTGYWGGVGMRFDSADLRRWPMDESDLAPFYLQASEEMGLCGTGDRPALKPTPAVTRLLTMVETANAADLRLDPFVPTLALRTRPDDPTSCVYCGACMSGCPRQSLYCASSTIQRMMEEGVVSQTITTQVMAMDLESRVLTISGADGRQEQTAPFDLILVAAGCLGTSQILLRSLPGLAHVDMLDNPVFTFPILVTGALEQASAETGYFGLTNGSISVIPADPAAPAASVQLYPAMDHLWSYFTPGRLWPVLAPFGRLLRRRLVIGRLYLHSDDGAVIRVGLSASSTPDLSLRRRGALPPSLWSSLRRALSRHGFLVPQRPVLRQKTSSHYAGTLPYGSAGLDGNGQLRPGVYLCDSTVFPDSPAASPTLTIMANAMRTAQAARPA